jgi:hypothetical protein
MINWIKRTFENNGNPDAAKVTAFIAFCVIVVQAGIDQFSGYKINETVFITFATIAATGLGISAFKK